LLLVLSALQPFKKHRRYKPHRGPPAKVKLGAGKQLKGKDKQIKAQAIHIQTLVNQKQIEALGAKEP
jgi:hypothetical protein